jgi:hypothetical protein
VYMQYFVEYLLSTVDDEYVYACTLLACMHASK